MNRDDVIRMGKEAGFGNYTHEALVLFEKLSNLVASHVAEECAKVCESRYMGDNNREDMEARRCATAIRSLYKSTAYGLSL